MQFKTFFFRLNTEERKDFAKKVGTSSGHLTNFSYGYTTLAPELCVAIERATEGAVTRQDLRPDNWQAIWPELAEAQPGRAQDAISDLADEAQAVILHVAETAEAEIKRAIEELRHGAPPAEPWDGVSERRHVSAPCGPPAPVDLDLALAMAEDAKAGLIERRRIVRRAQDKASDRLVDRRTA